MLRALIFVVMALAAAAFSCEECSAAGYNIQLTYERDGIDVECVAKDNAACTSEEHGVNFVRCHKECAILEHMDARLLVEGKYTYPEGSCFVRDRDECLDASANCEVVPEKASDKDGLSCVPVGFLRQVVSQKLGEPRPRGCHHQETCAQCVNQVENGCVYCARSLYGDTGECDTKCTSGSLNHVVFGKDDRDRCPEIPCHQCTGSDNIWRVVYKEKGVEVKCINEIDPGCEHEEHAGGGDNVRCYNHEACKYLAEVDSRLLWEGFHTYPANSCFGRDCDNCYDGSDRCEYWMEVQPTGVFHACAPKGFSKQHYYLVPVEKCEGRRARQCYKQETCGQCLNQERCVFCGDATTGEGVCATECPKECPSIEHTFADRDLCPKLTCDECRGEDNIWRLLYKEDGVDAKCVSEIDSTCQDEDHVVGSTRCYNHDRCRTVENPDMLLEGHYPYGAGTCFGRTCTECLDGSDNCEYYQETLTNGETTMGCLPARFVNDPTPLVRLLECPKAE